MRTPMVSSPAVARSATVPSDVRGSTSVSGSTLSFASFLHAGVECEIAVVLARDLAPGPCSNAEAAASVGELMAGIEVVERVPIPDALIPADARVEMDAKRAAGYFSTWTPDARELAQPKGRGLDE